MKARLFRTLSAIAMFSFLCPQLARAEETKLTTDEIQSAFAGNTVHGLWGDTEYYSYFDANGRTSYTTKRGTDWGHWRAAHDQYCSTWEMSGESCYDILREGDKIIWVLPSSGKRYDSTLIAGEPSPTFQ
ncbi:MAG: hypothetical protein ACREEE_18390 [Dongiaceae bacterium]